MNAVSLAHALLGMYLVALLAVPRVPTTLAALVCLAAIIGSGWRRPPGVRWRVGQSLALLVPVAGYAAIIIGQMLAGWLQARDADQLLMFLLTTGLLLSCAPERAPGCRQWLLPAAVAGALGALALAVWQYWGEGILRPHGHLGAGPAGSGAIKYGDLCGMLGLLSLVLMLDTSRQRDRVLGTLGCMAGMAAMGLTQSRGAVLGVGLALMVLCVLLALRRQRRRRLTPRTTVSAAAMSPAGGRLRGLLVMAVGAAMLVGASQFMAQRFADIVPQYERFQETGEQKTEVGQRLTLWGVAIRAGVHAPLTGTGINGFEAEARRQRDSGELPAGTQVLYANAHNEYLSAFASAGVPGLLVILGIFGAPLWVGCRRFLADGPRSDEALVLVMVSSSFAGFSLTDSMFERQISMLAYLLLASWFLAASRDVRSASREGGDATVTGRAGGGVSALFPGQTSALAMSAVAAGAATPQVAPAMAGAPMMAAVPAAEGGVAARGAAPSGAAGAGGARGPSQVLSVPGGLSVAIIAKNEAHCIARCLQSVAFADQIVVLDSGSTDNTVAIARSLGAEVEVTPDWPGFGPQKNRTLAKCRYRWVLSIDADEQVSPALAEEIRAVLTRQSPARGAALAGFAGDAGGLPARELTPPLAAETAAESDSDAIVGYWLRRSSRFCGQVIAHGLWGNDRVLRLFERTRGRFSDDPVHERLVCSGPTRVLDGMLVHDSVDSLDDAWTKTRAYAFLGASVLRARRRGGLFHALSHAGWAFVRGYVLRAGFLDGKYGLVVARMHARGTYWKYRWAVLPDSQWQALERSIIRP